ncbi:hypothetical protein HDR69_07315 [bacterium]|nr:hypothetical protein [Bacteroides sp.]MBD5386215.1 hypothetical protein [bacterium]MDE7509937.1 hypothetical protein [Muribaculaceae bacterium]
MSTNDMNPAATPAAQIPSDLETIQPAEVKGLTIREIRYQRALVALQKEFCREKMNSGILKVKNSSPFSSNYSGKTKPLGRAAGIAGKIVGGMNYIDYAILGFSIFSNVRKVFGFFKKKK